LLFKQINPKTYGSHCVRKLDSTDSHLRVATISTSTFA